MSHSSSSKVTVYINHTHIYFRSHFQLESPASFRDQSIKYVSG